MEVNFISYLYEKIKGIATEKQGNFQKKEIVIINGKEI